MPRTSPSSVRPQAGRGQAFEELLEWTHAIYRRQDRAVIQKVAVPVRLTGRRDPSGQFVGFYAAKSTVDFIGTVRGGRSVAVDAKSTRLRTRIVWDAHHFPPHQREFLAAIAHLGGLALLVVAFSALDRYFAIPYGTWAAHPAPSWTVAECAQWGYEVASRGGCPVDYLAPLGY